MSCFLVDVSKSKSSRRLPASTTTRVSSGCVASMSMRLAIRRDLHAAWSETLVCRASAKSADKDVSVVATQPPGDSLATICLHPQRNARGSEARKVGRALHQAITVLALRGPLRLWLRPVRRGSRRRLGVGSRPLASGSPIHSPVFHTRQRPCGGLVTEVGGQRASRDPESPCIWGFRAALVTICIRIGGGFGRRR